MKKLLLTGLALAVTGLMGCTDASVASRNLSKAADNFEVDRRIVFYNGITGRYILTVEGKCSMQGGNSLGVVCKVGHGEYVDLEGYGWRSEYQMIEADTRIKRYGDVKDE